MADRQGMGESVVRMNFLLRRAFKPCSRINRATFLRLISLPYPQATVPVVMPLWYPVNQVLKAGISLAPPSPYLAQWS
ncbi:MAG: hypothetical protein LBP88_05210 [Treponema sp.]|nr:hypothetical protein [Treponema sp.]